MNEYLMRLHISGGRTVNGIFNYDDHEEAVAKTEAMIRGKGKLEVPGRFPGRTYLVEKSYIVYAEVMKYDGGKLPDEKN